jgi:hemocyanin-like protein
MASLASIQERTWDLFLRPSPLAREVFAAHARALGVVEPEPITQFSFFDERHLARAIEVAAELMERAGTGSTEDGLERALDHYERLQGRENPDLLDYALMVLITHHPRGRILAHAIPPITLRNPELVAPSAVTPERAVHGLEMLIALRRRVELGVLPAFTEGALPSDGLEWFREDPFASEHHVHWHVVYPFAGIPDPADPNQRTFKDRQGEIFLYMHQQMLARYDAERLALPELEPVSPLERYAEPIRTGYDPGPYLQANHFFPRKPGARMVDLPPRPPQQPEPYTVARHDQVRARLREAVERREYLHASPPLPMTSPPGDPNREPSLLGHTIEATGARVRSADPTAPSPYGNLHNIGHNMLAWASTDELGNRRGGVMRAPTTAIRDPVFWEWHKHIDDLYARWQDDEEPHKFADRPPVRLRKQLDPVSGLASSPDILLLFEDQLPDEARHNPDNLQEWPHLQAWATATFGEDHWDDDGSATGLTTDTLETSMLRRDLVLADRVTTVSLDHLTHRPFVYLLRIENTADRALQVTVRIFLVPAARAEKRRAWIEMDKFVHALEPLQRSVVARRGAQSSVIRKPAVMAPQLLKADTWRFGAGDLGEMRADGLPAGIVALLQPFVDQQVLVATLARALGDFWTDAVVAIIARHVRVTRGDQPRPDAPPEEVERFYYCTCGWPYGLLLPRGSPEGMRFRLAVVCTDWEADRTPVEEADACGSVSFCGARDVYPDMRRMGYPFDRPFAGSISDTFMANDHLACRDLSIRRTPDQGLDG